MSNASNTLDNKRPRGRRTTANVRRDPFILRLWVFVVLGLLLIGGASAYYLNWQQQQHLARTRDAVQQLVRALSMQVGGELATTDAALDSLGRMAWTRHDGEAADPAMAAVMAEKTREVLGGLFDLVLVDTTGRPLGVDEAHEAAPQVMAWFRQHPAATRYLAPPQIDARSGQPVMRLAHVQRTPGGEIKGAGIAVIRAPDLLHAMADLRIGKAGQVRLLHAEGLTMVAQMPRGSARFAASQSLANFSEADVRGPDPVVFEAGDVGGQRVLAAQRVGNWPLIAVADASKEEIAAQMWRDLQGYLGIMLSLALLMVVLAAAVYHSHRKSREASLLSQTVFDAAPMGLAVFAGSGVCRAFNQAFLDQLAEPEVDMARRHYSTLPGWGDAGVIDLIEATRGDGRARSDLLKVHAQGGGERWLRFTVSSVRDRGRQHLLVTAFDMSEQVEARNALAESERRYRGFYESSQEGIVRTDARGRFLDANQAYLDMMGYALDELRQLRVRDVTDADDLAQERRMVREQADVRGYADEYEKSQRRKDGTQVELSIHLWRVLGASGEHAGYWSIVRDVTALKRIEAQRKLAAQVFESSAEAILVTDGESKILTVNPAFERITGYTAAEVVGRNPHMLSAGMQDDAYYQAMWAALNTTGSWEGEIWDRRKSGDIYLKWLRINSICDRNDGRVTQYVGVFSDITEKRKAEEQIHYLAHHDALTGLPNRFSLRAQLESLLGRARRDGGGLALMFIDLDNFKTINDSLGHHFGDQLLVRVAARLREALREGDTVARLGGDEFVVVMPGAAGQADAIGVATKIIDALRNPYEVADHLLYSSPSIGISLFPADGDDIETLMKNADSAMYHAKAQGRNNFQFYATHMNAAVAQRMALERALRKGLDAGQLLLHYQPQIDLRSGQVVGVEALVRWEDPVRGMIAPTEFIAVAEQSGLIVRLGAWVLRMACLQLKDWHERGIPIATVSINVSPVQFRHADFVPMVRQVLDETGVAPHCVDLEITEGVLMESSDRSIGVLQDLRDLGVTFSIDDFGTGYSSLSYIKAFPAQRLKIDRSFVSNLEHDSNDAVIATAIIALAHSLGMQVVAEGAETAVQVDFLRDHDCDFAQGYYFSRPLTINDLEVWVGTL